MPRASSPRPTPWGCRLKPSFEAGLNEPQHPTAGLNLTLRLALTAGHGNLHRYSTKHDFAKASALVLQHQALFKTERENSSRRRPPSANDEEEFVCRSAPSNAVPRLPEKFVRRRAPSLTGGSIFGITFSIEGGLKNNLA